MLPGNRRRADVLGRILHRGESDLRVGLDRIGRLRLILDPVNREDVSRSEGQGRGREHNEVGRCPDRRGCDGCPVVEPIV